MLKKFFWKKSTNFEKIRISSFVKFKNLYLRYFLRRGHVQDLENICFHHFFGLIWDRVILSLMLPILRVGIETHIFFVALLVFNLTTVRFIPMLVNNVFEKNESCKENLVYLGLEWSSIHLLPFRDFSWVQYDLHQRWNAFLLRLCLKINMK